MAADNLSIGLSADAYAVNTYGDLGVSYGVIETDTTGMSPQAKKNLAKVFDYNLSIGEKNRVSVLDEGMKYKRIALSMQEAQFVETNAKSVADIARWLHLPLHKLKVSGEGGYNFLVQMSIEYMQSAIQPLGQNIKEEIERKLLVPSERKAGYYNYMNYNKMLEVDPITRSTYYRNMYFTRSLNSNEIRAKEDLNPYDGGEEFLQPANMLNQAQIEKQLENEDRKTE